MKKIRLLKNLVIRGKQTRAGTVVEVAVPVANELISRAAAVQYLEELPEEPAPVETAEPTPAPTPKRKRKK